MKSALVVTVDGLNARFLGAYGNGWVPTPNLDSLASQSVLYENAIAQSTQIENALSAALAGALVDSSNRCELEGFDDLDSIFLTDDPGLASSVTGFQEVILSDFDPADSDPADSDTADSDTADSDTAEIGERLSDGDNSDALKSQADTPSESNVTRILYLFRAAAELWKHQAGTEPLLLWVHARGPGGMWDAPLGWQDLFKGEDDPSPKRFHSPPESLVTGDLDPDVRLEWMHAYAAEICEFDQALGELLEAVGRKLPSEIWLSGLRGYPLAEHGHVGLGDFLRQPESENAAGIEATGIGAPLLYAEQVHVPMIQCIAGDERFSSRRSLSIQQPCDMVRSLKAWFRKPIGSSETDSQSDDASLGDGPFGDATLDGEDRVRPREFALTLGVDAARIQTPAWAYSQPNEVDVGNPVGQLFVKPDDRQEINDVASACLDVQDGMRDLLQSVLGRMKVDGHVDEGQIDVPERLLQALE